MPSTTSRIHRSALAAGLAIAATAAIAAPSDAAPAAHSAQIGTASISGIGTFAVRGIDWSISSAPGAGLSIGDLELVKSPDATTAPLMVAAAGGRRLASARIDLGGASRFTAASYALDDVTVSQLRDSAPDAGVETVRLHTTHAPKLTGSLAFGDPLDPIVGTSELSGQRGIKALTMTWGVGQQQGRAAFDDVTIGKPLDAASPAILDDLLTGRTRPFASVALGGPDAPSESLALADTHVDSWHLHSDGSAAGAPTETVGLGFDKLAVGAQGRSASWNLSTGTSS